MPNSFRGLKADADIQSIWEEKNDYDLKHTQKTNKPNCACWLFSQTLKQCQQFDNVNAVVKMLCH